MDIQGLRCIHIRRRQRSLTDSRKVRGDGYFNLTRNLDIRSPFEVLSSDISYIRTGEGFDYLCQIKDVMSGVILAESISEHMRADLVVKTIKKAIRRYECRADCAQVQVKRKGSADKNRTNLQIQEESMSLFDKIKKNVSNNEGNKSREEIQSLGWDAITAELERVYAGQTNPKHYGTLIKWRLGGKDPLDGISIYDGGDYWHFVTFGMSELYVKESENKDYTSGYGYEMTLKLKKSKYSDEEAEIRCICGILQSVARITFTKNEVFAPYEFLYIGQTAGIDVNQKSKLTGFICVPDPTLNTLDTPFGKVAFLEFIGMTDAELKTLKTIQSVKDIYEKLGSDITDYGRESLV